MYGCMAARVKVHERGPGLQWWAAMSNVEAGQMTYPVNRGR